MTTTPKCLVSIQETVLEIWLQLCRRNNFCQVLINTHVHAVTNADLSKMMDFHRQKKQRATLAVYTAVAPRECGIIATDADQIVGSCVDKPSAPESDLSFAGIMRTRRLWLIDAIPDHLPADLGFHVLPRLGGHMAAYAIRDYPLDIGSPESYEYAQSTWPGLAAA